jgi:hypothetical protein
MLIAAGAAGYFVSPSPSTRGFPRLNDQEVPQSPSRTVIIATLIMAVLVIPLTYYVPAHNLSAEAKPYTDFLTFYRGPYTEYHRVAYDQYAHIIIFAAMLFQMVRKPNHLVPWVWSLSLGALSTRFLLSSGIENMESSLMFFVGVVVSKYYGVMVSYMGHYVAWMGLDLLSHVFLGRNGEAAIHIGKHYLGWGLISQGLLFFQLLLRFIGVELPL